MRRILLLIIVLVFAGCASSSQFNNPYSKENSILNLRANMEVLASDEFGGREAGKESEKVASRFIASEFKKYGIKPLGDDGTYFQSFQVIEAQIDTNSTISVIADGQATELKMLSDFAILPSYSPDGNEVEKEYETVFAGFGITAEEYDYDDYEDLEVEGKIVFVLMGEPYSQDPEFFNGPAPTKYSLNPFSKIKMAVEHNAAAVVFIPTQQIVAMWKMIIGMSVGTKLYFPEEAKSNRDKIPVLTLSRTAGEELFETEEMSIPEMEKTIEEKDIPVPFEMGKTIKLGIAVKQTEKTIRNVVGVAGEVKKDSEFITLSAHYDHIGISGDGRVNNGANDNASGTVAVMEVARKLADVKDLERPVLFCLFTAEEKGLIGSKYFVKNSSGNIFTNINMDMVGRLSPDSIYCIGSAKLSNDLKQHVILANEKSANMFLDFSLDENDPQRNFQRSDQISFHKKGIPAVFITDDCQEDYHTPADDYDKLDYEKIWKVTELVYTLSKNLSSLNNPLKLNSK